MCFCWSVIIIGDWKDILADTFYIMFVVLSAKCQSSRICPHFTKYCVDCKNQSIASQILEGNWKAKIWQIYVKVCVCWLWVCFFSTVAACICICVWICICVCICICSFANLCKSLRLLTGSLPLLAWRHTGWMLSQPYIILTIRMNYFSVRNN